MVDARDRDGDEIPVDEEEEEGEELFGDGMERCVITVLHAGNSTGYLICRFSVSSLALTPLACCFSYVHAAITVPSTALTSMIQPCSMKASNKSLTQ